MRAAHAHGKGVLLFTGHFGFWEINALVHALALRPMSVLARPLDNPLLHRLLESTRMKTGNSVIYRRGAIRRVLRALESNQAVAVLIDQHIQTADAVYVDFFNRPAATTSALAALALRTGAPVVPVFALPLPGGRFRMVYEHAVDPPSAEDPDAIREFTQRCTDVLEMYVRRYPELWLWMHRRWRDGGSEGRHDWRDVPGGVERGRRAVNRLVIRAPNWLGDAVMALPAMGAVRATFAGAHLAVAAIPSIAPLFDEETSARPDSVIVLADSAAPRSRR